MPIRAYLTLLCSVIALAGLTVALAHWAGAFSAMAPVALVLAWLVRRGM